MSSSPFFSVIIPTYNRAAMLPRAVDSVLSQRFEDWELIIIDDGSQDETKLVIDKYSDDRIQYFYQENQERSAARNNGIDKSKGRYICFLDSDDNYMDNHLEALHQHIQQKELPIAFFFTDVIRDDGEQTVKVSSSDTDLVEDASFILTTPESIIPCRICAHSSVLEEYRFDERIRIGEDTDLWIRIMEKYPLHHVKAYTVTYHVQHDRTTSLKYNPFRGRLYGLRILFKKQASRNIPSTLKRKKISDCYFGIAGFHENKKNYIKMTGALLMSIVIYPVDVSTKHKVYLILKHIPLVSKLLKG